MRLDEFSKEEWRDIIKGAIKALGGEWDEAWFERAWEEFQQFKSEHNKKQRLH